MNQQTADKILEVIYDKLNELSIGYIQPPVPELLAEAIANSLVSEDECVECGGKGWYWKPTGTNTKGLRDFVKATCACAKPKETDTEITKRMIEKYVEENPDGVAVVCFTKSINIDTDRRINPETLFDWLDKEGE